MSCCIYAVVSNQNTNLIYVAPSREVTRRSLLYNYACKLQLALVYTSICIIKSFAWRRLMHVYVRIRKKHKQAKKNSGTARAKTLRRNILVGNRTQDLSLKRQKDRDEETRINSFNSMWYIYLMAENSRIFECQRPNRGDGWIKNWL